MASCPCSQRWRGKRVSWRISARATIYGPAVHRRDAARLYRLALERGARGEAYHNVAEQGVPYRAIAEAIGRQTGLPVRSLTPEEAEGYFGPLAMWVGNNGPVSNEWNRDTLGWTPTHPGIVADIEQPDYSTEDS